MHVNTVFSWEVMYFVHIVWLGNMKRVFYIFHLDVTAASVLKFKCLTAPAKHASLGFHLDEIQ